MNNIRFIDTIFLILLIVLLIMTSFESKADKRIRFYDTSDGWAKPTYEYADKQFDGSYRVYDSKGRFKGKVAKDRFYNRKGKPEQKYYLFTK